MSLWQRLFGGGKTPASTGREPATEKPAGEMDQVRIPYSIDQRPMPQSDDPEILLPRQVGPYIRKQLDLPEDIRIDSIDVEYRSGWSFITVELAICDDRSGALRVLWTARREAGAESLDEGQVFSDREDPSFLKLEDFMAWTRGRYYFSAHASGGKAALDAFMTAFPY
jgi:hypothetical protein